MTTSAHLHHRNPDRPCQRLRRAVMAILLLGLGLVIGCKTPEPPVSPKQEVMVLREGDVVKITFPSSPNLDAEKQIQRNGTIDMPLIGEVPATELTPRQLQDHLIEMFQPKLAAKDIKVSIVSSSYPIYVTGLVGHPGKLMVTEPMTVVAAILESGGFDYAKADLRAVRLVRHENGKTESFKLDLKRVMEGKDSQPFYVRPGDIIYVPEAFTWF